MKEKRNCKIVQDLLPNYIEKLTNSETNNYIEEHLKECEECKKIYEEMKKDIKLNSEQKDKREVKYIKKYSSKMKILKFIILVILIVFASVTARKISIIANLYNKSKEYNASTNYHRIAYSYSREGYTKVDIYRLGDKQKMVTTKLTDEGKEVTRIYTKEKTTNKYGAEVYLTNIYIETDEYKILRKNKELGIKVDPQSPLYQEIEGMNSGWMQVIIGAIPSTIKKASFDGKECYCIINYNNMYSPSSATMYLDINTGLPIAMLSEEMEYVDGSKGRMPATEYFYEFNTVTEEDFKEPDINEYIID